MHPAAAPVEVATRFRREQMVESADDQMAHFLRVADLLAALVESLFHLPIVIAGAFDLVPALLLKERTGPLGEIAAPVMIRVPRAAMDFNLLRRRIFAQILADVYGRKAQS